MLQEIEDRGDLTEEERDDLARDVEATGAKFRDRYAKEMRRRDKQERGKYGAKTWLLEEHMLGELE